jgi:hypothetical protein
LDIAFIENILFSLVFLEALVIGQRHPDQLIPAFDNARFDLYSFGLDVFLAFNVDLARDCFSFLKGCLVEGHPYLALWMC